MSQIAYLTLANGAIYKADPFGDFKEETAELVFTTSMTGYIETLTDPSYYGQIVVQTFPLIGNAGVIPEDYESEAPKLKGYIVRQWCQDPSNYRMKGSLDTFLKNQSISGLSGLDTRSLAKTIREYGVMNCHIGYEPWIKTSQLEEIRAFSINDAIKNVSVKESYYMGAFTDEKYKTAVWDFGAKRSIAKELQKRGCSVLTIPYNYKAEDILNLGLDGIMLSNGPGDPASQGDVIREIRKVADSGLPMFGICLGHQLLALAMGGETKKLKYGHRGSNQPVRDNKTGRVYITSQNHGYYVVSGSLPSFAEERMTNLNDMTCEGVDYLDRPAFSVQYHPEAGAGPLDNMYLFERFLDMMQSQKKLRKGGE